MRVDNSRSSPTFGSADTLITFQKRASLFVMRRTGACGVPTLMAGTRRLTSRVIGTVIGPVACYAFLRKSFRMAQYVFIRCAAAVMSPRDRIVLRGVIDDVAHALQTAIGLATAR